MSAGETKKTGKSTTRSPRTSAARRTAKEGAESAFTASAAMTDDLQRVLVDLIELASQGKQLHWNVVGRNFRDTHLQLDEIIDAARGFADTIAERMRALHALPDGRSAVVAKSTTLADAPQGEVLTSDAIDLMTARLDAVAATCRDVHDEVDEEDPTSADMLHAILERVEQLSWMVSAENRTPKTG